MPRTPLPPSALATPQPCATGHTFRGSHVALILHYSSTQNKRPMFFFPTTVRASATSSPPSQTPDGMCKSATSCQCIWPSRSRQRMLPRLRKGRHKSRVHARGGRPPHPPLQKKRRGHRRNRAPPSSIPTSTQRTSKHPSRNRATIRLFWFELHILQIGFNCITTRRSKNNLAAGAGAGHTGR